MDKRLKRRLVIKDFQEEDDYMENIYLHGGKGSEKKRFKGKKLYI